MSSLALSPAASRPAVNMWIVAFVVVVPTFMEILDTTIANVALRYIAGGLSAAVIDAEWVLTSYLAANATILPISGWISAHLGRRKEFEGRITGFTMGTGQTLSLLPPENATGNFVKIVQRLPVRIELTNYDPDKEPLFVGLSVVPYVYYKEQPTGPSAGDVLQPLTPLPTGPTEPKP